MKFLTTKHLQLNTHYIYSVLVQDITSGKVCCVIQYHYETRDSDK